MSTFITASGLTTAVGVGTAPACAAMRAGLDGFTDLPYLDDEQEPITGAPVPTLDWSRAAPLRAATLLATAVEELAERCRLVNLDPRGSSSFCLPNTDMPVEFTRADGSRVDAIAHLDTLIIDLPRGQLRADCCHDRSGAEDLRAANSRAGRRAGC
ncbi:3-oxoacyl-(acyl carrier protein) synthase [Enhygromyxa salina]|uniref:3-oxoacyl-(Acyl carrier protein) synthase n=1 Tax=Enhygromyxa salina TaxID=215803 RepID=A0A2S9YL25_9BACT|nr:hypothetical protein [Enhygromyxa salina]PRQ05815.1 3-oxoacyl-(acyl carrier protein) synthase [Enhygromyxa salina]